MGSFIMNGEEYSRNVLDLKNKIVTFDSGDELNPTAPAEIPKITSGHSMKDFLRWGSLAVKNVRYLLKMLGNTDISSISNGTLTGAISKINEGLSGKAGSITGAASTITSSNLTTNRALVSNASGKVAAFSVTAAELGYMSGTTSNIQNQINTLKEKSESSITWAGIVFAIYKCGNQCELKVVSGALSGDMNAYTLYTVGTIATGFRPYHEMTKIIWISEAVSAMLNISVGGVVTLRPYAKLGKGYTPLISEVYMCIPV